MNQGRQRRGGRINANELDKNNPTKFAKKWAKQGEKFDGLNTTKQIKYNQYKFGAVSNFFIFQETERERSGPRGRGEPRDLNRKESRGADAKSSPHNRIRENNKKNI